MHRPAKSNRQRDRQRDRQTDRQTERKKEKKKERKKERQTEIAGFATLQIQILNPKSFRTAGHRHILKRAANEFQLVAVNQTLCRDIAKYITAS